MASFVINGLEQTAQTLADGETGFVTEGSELLVDGAVAVDGAGYIQLTVLGNITTFGDNQAVDHDGTSADIFIGAAGSVISNSDIAFSIRTSDSIEFVNAGTVLADGTAVGASDADGAVPINIINSGTIIGNRAIAFDSGLTAAVINNSGTLLANGTTLDGSLSSGDATIHNSGTISSTNTAAINLGSGDDTVINTGQIIGGARLGTGNDLFDGSAGIQALAVDGGGDDDTLIGGSGRDTLDGGAGSDSLVGQAGNDVFLLGDADLADDEADGGDGRDTVDVTIAFEDLVINLKKGTIQGGFAGTDSLVSIENAFADDGNQRITGDDGTNVLKGGVDDDTLLGRDGDDRLSGGEDEDELRGNDGDDRLRGGADNDRLFGNGGEDLLIGGAGADTLTGGNGPDTFLYKATTDSGTSGTRDLITDFVPGTDKIDLTGIDGNDGTVLNDTLVFIGNAPFSGTPGEVRITQNASTTSIKVSTDLDTGNEMVIRIDGQVTLTEGDFIL